ncbi:MAG: hypothetical protein ACK58Q_13345 [Chitinophagales bacterium]
MTNKEKLSDLLSNKPLYKKTEVELDFFRTPEDIENFCFSQYCPVDKGQQTFKLNFEPKKILEKGLSTVPITEIYNSLETYNDKECKYQFTQHFSATCQTCNEYKVNYLLQVETNQSIPKVILSGQERPALMQIVKKICQFPSFEITPDKSILNFLNQEDQENYKKALICLSQNYGIAAFAYFRRIVENEIIRIIEDIAKLDRPESSNITSLIDQYKGNHAMSNLIEGIYEYLPLSLKSLGNNPLKILYSQLSGGIHEYSEEVCSEKSEQINNLLVFVVKKIYEENSEVNSARKAINILIQ